MANNSSFADESTVAPSQGMLAAEWGLLGFLALTTLYLTIASAIYQLASKQPGLKTNNRLCTLSWGLLLLSAVSKVIESTHVLYAAFICTWIIMPHRMYITFSRFFVYLSLWFRQHLVYKSVNSTAKWTRFARKLSLASVTGISIFTFVQIFGVLIYLTNPVKSEICGGNRDLLPYIVVSTIGFSFSQLVLLFLMFLPLSKYFSDLTDVKSVYVRSACTAAVCVVSDLIITVILVFADKFAKHFSKLFMPHLVTTNYVLNATALIFSFPDYATRLFPFKLLLRRLKPNVVVPCSSVVYNGNKAVESDDSPQPRVNINAWEKDVKILDNTVSAKIDQLNS